MKIIVIGAGPVGATFALLAKRAGLDVSLLEARAGVSRETRTLALSHGSREILDIAHAWKDDLHATPIHAIHTSQKGGFGRTLITREDGGVPALGYVLTYADIQTALDEAMRAAEIVTQRGAVVSAIDQLSGGAEITFTQDGAIKHEHADVVVMADGGANLSKVPALTVSEKDYGQAALLGRITTDKAHEHRAYERFTPEGPAALLPKGEAHSYSLVWVSSPARIEELKALDDAAFCAAFQAHFGFRAGKFLSVTDRRSYPLRLRTVDAPVAGSVVVIGNAAQALHPVAGQGFNLGLRDAHALADALARDGEAMRALARYATARERDVSRSVGFTDFLVRAFSNDHALTRVPRGLGLAAVDLLPGARAALAQRMLFGGLQ
jgi:2-octaprenyl-6-methoxyphenol hydroxylase